MTPAYAVASHAGDAVLSKKVDRVKPGKGVGRGNGGGRVIPEAPTETVEAPAPTVEAEPTPTTSPAPAPAESPEPVPTASPKPKPAPAAAKPKPAPAAAKPKPAPTQAAPAPTPADTATPTPSPTRDDRASGESRDDRAGVGIGAAPGGGGSAPAMPVGPGATPGATPGSASPTPAGGTGRGRRVTAPRVTGGLIDMVDRAGGDSGTSGGGGSAPASNRGSGSAAPVAYREDPRSGRRVYAVPTSDGRTVREVSVPSGVFGILPSAAIEAKAEVRSAITEGRSRKSVPAVAETESAAPRGVAETMSRPLEVIDEATGGVVPPGLVLAGLAAMAAVLALGIRRELHRW